MSSGKADITEEDSSSGPSIDSTSMEERIEARRRRIARRLQTLKNAASGDEVTQRPSTAPESDLSKSKKQVEESYQRISKLVSDGTDLVSIVEVACHAREVATRTQEQKNRRLRMEKLEQESEIASQKFESITKKWEQSVSEDGPQNLHKLLNSQKQQCDGMISEKVQLIDELQQQLKQKDEQYVKDLRKQAEDADLIIERMDEQKNQLSKVYAEELNTIEAAFVSERKDLLTEQKKIWEDQSASRRSKEEEYMKLRESRVEEFEKQLQQLRVQDAEEYNMVKIKLEKDVQTLEQNLQQMKATYQLNQEKLEYNFQVLKKRDEENTITKSQQKRKITRLQDLLNNLKQKLRKQEHTYVEENQTLSDDLKRMTEQYKELQKKFRHFQATDSKKFGDIWKMNEEQIKELVSDVLKEDNIIYEQQLGLPWTTPDLEFLKNVGPIKLSKQSKSAMETAHNALSSTASDGSRSPSATGSTHSSHEQTNETAAAMLMMSDVEHLSSLDIKKMLELLCDEAGFLVEAKLIKLLAPIEKDERSLMKLDAIFNAIGIESEEDITLLAKYLHRLQYVSDADHAKEDDVSNVDDVTDGGDELSNCGAGELKQVLIAPNDVVKALRQFVEDNNQPSSKKVVSRFNNSKDRDSSKDEEYWKQLASVIDGKKERVWDALIEGFEKYSQVLVERSSLIQETDGLRQQNSELRMLLHQYLNSKVNQELEIPPTRVLQMELAHHNSNNNFSSQ